MGRAFGYDLNNRKIVEIEAGDGLPVVAGPPRHAVQTREGLARVRTALGRPRLGVVLPSGSAWNPGLDLAVVAAAVGAPAKRCYVGEVGLDGRVRPVRGTLAAAEAATARGLRPVVAAEKLREGVSCHFPDAFGASHVEDLQSPQAVRVVGLPPLVNVPSDADREKDTLLTGTAGTGLLQAALATCRTEIDAGTAYEVDVIYDLAGLLRAPTRTAPVRVPHHTVSVAGMIGAGSRPGECHLAHGGTLVLDQLDEWALHTIQAIAVLHRDPGLRFRLVATAYPCPCGWPSGRGCRCTPEAVARKRERVDLFCRLLGIERRVEAV